ncbi:hypothetical protein Poly51_59160 [Rubripirellula tenax]|uniref:Uncharacterized protein n=1 Tax=Rubripirellula tenax TaxID=2528015 RepID=A0A5C6E9P7_9BACT|nr:hypothetical protein [Rubripirellula tenax]TWU44647.1 hypothetical protein Poly51_59160 [Rubripirellula tenax]
MSARVRNTNALVACLLIATIGCGPRTETFDNALDVPSGSVVEVPAIATQISVTHLSGQHRATFTADLPDVKQWVNDLRALKPELNANPPSEDSLADANEYLKPTMINEEREAFTLRMGSPSGFTEDMLKFVVVQSPRGGVTTLWHDPDTSSNYLWAVYR